MIQSPAPVVTKVAQLGKTFTTTFNDKHVVVGFAAHSTGIQIIYVLRDVTGCGDWEDILTTAEWKLETVAQIKTALEQEK